MNNKTGIRRKQEDTVVSMWLLVSHMGSPVAFFRQQTFFLSFVCFKYVSSNFVSDIFRKEKSMFHFLYF